MSPIERRRFALLGLVFILLAIAVIQTGLAANDWIFYGMIALFLLSQIFWFFYLAKKSQQEDNVRLLGKIFPDD